MRNMLILGEYENPVQKMIDITKEISDNFSYKVSQIYQNEYHDGCFNYGINFKEKDYENLLLLSKGNLLWIEHDYEEDDESTNKIVDIYNFIILGKQCYEKRC